MAFLPHDGPMGRLVLDEVFVRYDGPRLFSCSNEAGAHFVGVFVDEDADSETYIYAPASEARLAAVRSGQLDLRSALADPLDGGVFVVRSSGGATETSWRPAADVPPEWLPDENVRLNVPTTTHAPLTEQFMSQEALSVQRTLAAFELDAPWATTEFPLRPAGELMRLIQDSVEAFGQVVRGKKTDRGAIQHDILEDAELSLYGLKAASFAVVIASAPRPRLFEDPLVGSTFSLMFEVMDAATSIETLQATLEQLHPRALSKYRDLLEELEDAGTGMTALLAPPGQVVRRASLSTVDVSRSLALVRTSMGAEVTEITVSGLLVGVNARTNTFEILDENSDRTIRGKVVSGARSQIIGLTIGSRYRATVLQEAEIQPVTGDIRYKHRLVDITDPAADGGTSDLA